MADDDGEKALRDLKDTELLRRVGETLYGVNRWQRPMAKALGIAQSTLGLMTREDNPQPLTLGMKMKIRKWCRDTQAEEARRMTQRRQLLRELRTRWK